MDHLGGSGRPKFTLHDYLVMAVVAAAIVAVLLLIRA